MANHVPFWRPPILMMTGIAVVLGMSPVQAQSEPEGIAPAHVCSVFLGEDDGEGAKPLNAACWGTGIVLGRADQFQTLSNLDLGATLVAIEHSGKVRLLLLRALPDGRPIVEDLRSPLAEAAGRGPFGSIDDLTFDFDAFETLGVIAVSDSAGNSQPSLAQQEASGISATVSPGLIDIAALIQNDPANAAAMNGQ